MLSPEYLARIAEGSEEIASQLHTYIIRQIIDRMMIRIGRGDDYLLTSSDRWRIQILQDAGYLLEDITAELSKVTKRQEKKSSPQWKKLESRPWNTTIKYMKLLVCLQHRLPNHRSLFD